MLLLPEGTVKCSDSAPHSSKIWSTFSVIKTSRWRGVIVQFLLTPRQQLFGILRESIFKIDLVIRLKGDRNSFLGQDWVQKLSEIHILWTAEHWLTTQNDHNTYFNLAVLRYIYPSNNWKGPKKLFFCFLGPYNDKVA